MNSPRVRFSAFLFIGVIVCSFVFTGTSFAGAWTQEKGGSYSRLALNHFYSEKEYNDDGDRVRYANDGSFRDTNLNLYLEYGILESITFIGSFYYKDLKREDDISEFDSQGFGDFDLAVKVKLMDNSIGVLSCQGLVKVPELYDEKDQPSIGDGEYDFELRLLYGRSLWPILPGYFNVEGGYRWRNENAADELRLIGEIGMDVTKRVYARIKLDALLGMDNGQEGMDSTGNPTLSNNFDIVKFDATVGYKINEKWSVEAEYTPTVYGENSAYGQTYTLALVMQGW